MDDGIIITINIPIYLTSLPALQKLQLRVKAELETVTDTL